MAEFHVLQNARGLVMNNPQITQVIEAERRGLKILLKASIPAAAYDSSEHPRHCHPGTRYRYIDQIVDWGLNNSNHRHRIFWLKGPAGVGKSAIAQSCAEEFAAQKKLVAAFFFSRPNQRDDPQRLFTSISYQWASKHKAYSQIVKSTIDNDPTIVDKELLHQFRHLLVSPLQELDARGEKFTERVVIIDGLDECADETAQCTIIKAVAASIRKNTTPFVWIICSRLEPHLIATFNSRAVSALTRREELTVSRDIDIEIAKYLTDELAGIAEEHGLILPWPRERDIGTLVNLSAGLYIYASTVVRFIGDRNSFGPKDQLQTILALATSVDNKSSEHPLSELDFFYLLIVQRIPAKLLQAVQWILLGTTIIGPDVAQNRQLLGLSSSQFHTACRTLHSVMKVEDSKIVFYHASFMDFMQDPLRSKQFCIRSESAVALRTDLMERLQAVCNDPDIKGKSEAYALLRIDSDSTFVFPNIVRGFIFLCSALPWDAATFAALGSFNFKRMAEIWPRGIGFPLLIDAVFQHIPEKYRGNIIRSYYDSQDGHICARELAGMQRDIDLLKSYILGCGQNKCFALNYNDDVFALMPYPEHLAAKCPATENPTVDYSTIGRDNPRLYPGLWAAGDKRIGRTDRTFMRHIKFWRARTFRRLAQWSRSLIPGRGT